MSHLDIYSLNVSFRGHFWGKTCENSFEFLFRRCGCGYHGNTGANADVSICSVVDETRIVLIRKIVWRELQCDQIRGDTHLKLVGLFVTFHLSLLPVLLHPFAGTRNPHQHGLRCGAAPLGRLPGPPAALRRLEKSVGHQGDQHGGIPAPQARPLPPRLHPQRHQRKATFYAELGLVMLLPLASCVSFPPVFSIYYLVSQ